MKSILFLFIFLTGTIFSPIGDKNTKISGIEDLEISKRNEILSGVSNMPFILSIDQKGSNYAKIGLDFDLLKDCFNIMTKENGEVAIFSCAHGGPGASSCSSSSGDNSCSVECNSGYYACCGNWGSSCICMANDIQ